MRIIEGVYTGLTSKKFTWIEYTHVINFSDKVKAATNGSCNDRPLLKKTCTGLGQPCTASSGRTPGWDFRCSDVDRRLACTATRLPPTPVNHTEKCTCTLLRSNVTGRHLYFTKKSSYQGINVACAFMQYIYLTVRDVHQRPVTYRWSPAERRRYPWN